VYEKDERMKGFIPFVCSQYLADWTDMLDSYANRKVRFHSIFLGFLLTFTPSPGFLPRYPQFSRLQISRVQAETPKGLEFDPAAFGLTVVCPTTLGKMVDVEYCLIDLCGWYRGVPFGSWRLFCGQGEPETSTHPGQKPMIPAMDILKALLWSKVRQVHDPSFQP